MEIEPQRLENFENTICPFRTNEYTPEDLLFKNQPIAQDPTFPSREISHSKHSVSSFSGDILVIVNASDQTQSPLQQNHADDSSQTLERFELPLAKKFLRYEANRTLRGYTKPKKTKLGQLQEKLSKLSYREGMHRSHRKDIGRHLHEIAEVIQEDILEDSSEKEEQYWLDLFSQLVAEIYSYRSLWKLLDESFDKFLFRKILYMTSEQRKEFERKAMKEVEKSRMYNSTTKHIIFRLIQPLKLARKSFFEPLN